MAEKFDPAPHDKHAADPKAAIKDDHKTKKELDNGLRDTFQIQQIFRRATVFVVDLNSHDRSPFFPEQAVQLFGNLSIKDVHGFEKFGIGAPGFPVLA